MMHGMKATRLNHKKITTSGSTAKSTDCQRPLKRINSEDTSYQMKQKSIDSRRQKEIREWRNQFVFAISFALPVFLISMVFPHLSSTSMYFEEILFWGISREELWAWILATPVQFGSGMRFYRDSYHSIKSGKLGMSFLIAMGTTAAYFYSVAVVVYNSMMYNTGVPRLMQSFDSSAMLIAFILTVAFGISYRLLASCKACLP